METKKLKQKKYPKVAVAVILRYRDKILILKHKNGALKFPGGKMEWGESILGALYRELKEELNYSLKKEPELFSVFNYISKDKKEHTVFIDYIYPLAKKPRLTSPEKLGILWLTKKELISKNITKDEKFLDKIFSWKLTKKFRA
jgi:ADP-ribose pyrophosphatase YjhB (NUDIX family)